MLENTINNDKTIAGGIGTMLAGSMLPKRPDNVFKSAKDIALVLVSDLAGVPFGDVRFGKRYVTNGVGGFYEVTASECKGQTTVDIFSDYDFDNSKFQNDYVLKDLPFRPLIQIHCEAFEDGYNLRATSKADFIDLYEKSMILIDSWGHVERLNLDKVMVFNRIETMPYSSTLPEAKAYSYSWHRAAMIALSEKTPTEKWKDFVETVKQFCNLLDTGFKRFGLWENKTWQESVRLTLTDHNYENRDNGQESHSKNHMGEKTMKCNEKMCFYIWKLHTGMMILPKFLLLIPGGIFKNILALVVGILHLTIVLVALLTMIWFLLLLPMLMFSILSKIPIVGWLFALFGLPIAIVSEMFLECMPSFAVLTDPNDAGARTYWGKIITAESYPFSIEFSPLGKRFKKRESSRKIFMSLERTPIVGKFLPDDFFDDDERMLDI